MRNIVICILIVLLLIPAASTLSGFDNGGIPQTVEPARYDAGDADDNTRAGSRAITANDLIWPMFGKDKHHTFIAKPPIKGIFTPDEKWAHGSQIDSLGAAVGNFEANIFGTYNGNVNFIVYADDGMIYIVDGGTGESAWELNCDLIENPTPDNDLVYTSPAIGDLNKNGKMDIVFAVDDVSNNSFVYAYEPMLRYNSSGFNWDNNNHATEQLWSYYTGVDMSFSSPVLADIDKNGNLDVVIGGSDSSAWLFAIGGNDGKALSGNWPYELSGTRTSTPAIYEFGSNSRVVITTIELDTYYVYVISDSAQTLHQKTIDMNLPVGLAYSMIPSPAVGQLNTSSSSSEIVVCVPSISGNGKVYSLSNDLSTNWISTYTQGQFESSPAIVDIDKDKNGDMDVVVASWDGFGTRLYAIEGRTGARIWDTYKSLGVGVQSIIASPVLVDVNTDNSVDAIFVAQDVLFALNGTNGGYLWNFSMPSSAGARIVRSSPAVGDIDRDKFLDIFVDGSLISHYIIDLTLSPDDVEFSESEFIQGQEISITAVIHNTGQATAENVLITFSDNSNFIDNSTIESIPGGDTRGATVQWMVDESGDHTIKISVDPDNNIEEIVETNNELSIKVNVVPAFPDLTFDMLRFYRGDGKLIDNINTHLIENEESRAAAVVRNVGGLKANNILVKFREGSLVLGVDQLIGELDVNKTVEVGLNWTPVSGYHNIEALVDPANAISEVNESNNRILQTGLYVKSSETGDASYTVTGLVYKPDGTTPAGNVKYTITNERTQNFLVGTTNSQGRYGRDLKELVNRYKEGDKISIYITDGTNESMLNFKAYSEDSGRHDNVTLSTLPRYSIKLSVEDDALDVDPGSFVDFVVNVENKGNTNNTIKLNHTAVFDVNTNLPAVNWSVNLDGYSVDDLSEGGGMERRLTVRPPTKSSEAQAGQVVKVTVNAQSENDKTQVDSINVYATLNRMYLISLDIDPVFIKFNPSVNNLLELEINMTNNGNGPDQVSITTSNVTLDAISIDVATPVSIELGGKVTEIMKLRLQPDHQPGLYYMTVHVHSADGSSTRLRHITVQIVRPDLSVKRSDISLPGTLPGIGETITLTVKIYNNGTAPADGVEVALQEAGDTLASEIVSRVLENSAKTVYLSFIVPREGQYDLKVIVDPNNIIMESNENNNEASFSFGLFPDLAAIGELDMSPFSPREGQKVTLKVTVINLGSVAVSKNFNVEFYYYSYDKRVRIKKVQVTETLGEGETRELSVQWDARRDVDTIYCEIDSDFEVTENNKNNNEVSLNISVRESLVILADDEGLNYAAIGAVVFIIIIIIVLFLMFIQSRYDDEFDDEEEELDSKKAEGPKKAKEATVAKRPGSDRKSTGPKREKPDSDDDSESEEEEGIVSDIIGGVKRLNPFAPPVKKKKVKKKRAATAREVLDTKKERRPAGRTAEQVQRAHRERQLDKIDRADSLIKSRDLVYKEKQLERRSHILTKKEKELRSVKEGLVEIGILEADAIDDLEKEEVGFADEDEPVEVEPIE